MHQPTQKTSAAQKAAPARPPAKINEPWPRPEVFGPPARYCFKASYVPNKTAFPGTSRASVGTMPLKRPLDPPSDWRTCRATSMGPPYFMVTVAGPEVASALWACNLQLWGTNRRPLTVNISKIWASVDSQARTSLRELKGLYPTSRSEENTDTDLHLMSSVGQARKETATPAPAPHTTCWPTVRVTPGSDLSRASIWPRTVKRTALKAATVASGAPIPLYRPLGPSAAIVCFTASMAPAYLGSCPGRGAG
ncbi:transducin/WD40 repeat-like superfamily protein [Striga asiatica]|uniref:Transducin/WD40 repeat-like superfamily protein n=1 Tax=Striga asiatica TaxID=4170 RepID=A0A5A7QP23_STRAF|nr:transducin/WD40 repeat-like superfamily protein [Striga asiatica]